MYCCHPRDSNFLDSPPGCQLRSVEADPEEIVQRKKEQVESQILLMLLVKIK